MGRAWTDYEKRQSAISGCQVKGAIGFMVCYNAGIFQQCYHEPVVGFGLDRIFNGMGQHTGFFHITGKPRNFGYAPSGRTYFFPDRFIFGNFFKSYPLIKLDPEKIPESAGAGETKLVFNLRQGSAF